MVDVLLDLVVVVGVDFVEVLEDDFVEVLVVVFVLVVEVDGSGFCTALYLSRLNAVRSSIRVFTMNGWLRVLFFK